MTTTTTTRGLTGRRVGYVEPGSAEWRTYMTASKIAAVLGHSPYASRFSLWHEMAGTIPRMEENDETQRGHLLEPAIAEWFASQHPDAKLYRSAMYAHRDIPWAAATPDRIIRYGDGREPEGLECKSGNNPWEWGEEGTDQIPLYYYDQCIWQAGVLGVPRVRVAAILSGLQFRKYVVEFDQAKFDRMVAEAGDFMGTLKRGEKPSLDPLDGHMDTYQAIRYLHPDIELDEVEIPQSLAMQAQCAVLDKDRNEKELTAIKSQLIDLMDTAKDALFEGKKIARRQAKGDGKPFLVFQPQLKKHDLTSNTITEGVAA